MQNAIEDIHNFWFGELNADGLASKAHNRLWFIKNKDTDALIHEHFSALLKKGALGELDQWAESERGLIALIVLLDQFSRNIHRDSPEAFATDDRAVRLALAAIDDDRHLQLPLIHRVFLYLPLEHCENLKLQERCVELFDALAKECTDPRVVSFARYARAHLEVIARFDRFPHRNRVLGRDTTAAELSYLREHGGF